MLLNGGGGSRSALRPRSANDENAVVGVASKALGSAKTPGGGGGGNTNKPTVRLALGPAKSLDANGSGGGGVVAKTPGPSNARRRAFGDISNRKAGRGPGNQNAGAGGAKTPKAVSFQSNLFGPPPAKTPGGGGLGNGGGGGGKSAKKKGLQLQQQRTPFVSRNPNINANANTHTNRSVSFEPSASSTIKLPSNAVMPMSSRKEQASKASSVVVPRTTSVVQDQTIDEDDGGGSVSSVELPAGGRIWDPSDFFGDDDSYDLAAKIAAVNTSLDDDPSFVMPTFPSKAAAAAGTDADDDRLFAKEVEELEKEDYETLDHLLNEFAPEDDDGYAEDDLLSGLTPSVDDHDDDDHDDGLALLDDLDDLALA